MKILRIRAFSTYRRNRVEIGIFQDEGDEKLILNADTLKFEKSGDFEVPAFPLRFEHAQELMDDLWACGLRPTEGAGSAGALAATQRHLEDMRTLVFKERGHG